MRIFDKPGTTNQSFNADKLECMATTNGVAQQYSVMGNIYMIAAVAAANQRNQEDVFNTCMQARGYTLHIEDAATAAQKKQLAAQLKELGLQERACFQVNRDKPIYASLLPHLPNLETGYTPAQLADPNIPSPSESQLLSEATDSARPCRDRYITDVSKVVPALGPILQQQEAEKRHDRISTDQTATYLGGRRAPQSANGRNCQGKDATDRQ
jgi:hypothetical protein